MCVLNGDWNLPIGVGTIYAVAGPVEGLMQIQIDHNHSTIETTLAALLRALESVSNSDDEIEAVLLSLVNERRLRFVLPSALAA